jgi:3-hydroxyisobutyrate dehydrogenase-like beta-hydroxyacid dehydrogenase
MVAQIAKKGELIGIVGLGNMGGAIASNLIKKSFGVLGYDLDNSCCEKLVLFGGNRALDIRELAKTCRFIILSLPSQSALVSVAAELCKDCESGTIILECSTLGYEDKLSVFETFAGTGIKFLDAPISGTGAQAVHADLAVFLSGNQEAANACTPLVEAFSRAHYYLGKFGNGTKMKLVANMLVAIHNVAAAEGLLFGEHLGLDPQLVYDVIDNSAGASSG